MGAIGLLRAAHVRAGVTLSRLLLQALPQSLSSVSEHGTRVDLGFVTVTIVCIESIADAPEERPVWEVNRLLIDDRF